MGTDGIGRQSRLCVILVKVGTPVARAVFEKRVKDLTPTNHNPSPWTVDEFLLENKPKIRLLKLKSQIWSKIFPVQSQMVTLQQWDLSLLCTILSECCDLLPDIGLYIAQLRKLRNKFFHMSEPSIDDHKYQHYLAKQKVIFDRCLKEINDDAFTTEMNKMFEKLEQGQFSQVDAEDVMKKLQSMQEETNVRLYELGQNQRSTNEKLDDLFQKVLVLTTSLESANKLKVPESGAKMEVRNCSSEKENEISKLMVQCFGECIADDDDGESSECSTTSHAKCKEAVYKMYTKLLSKGYKIICAHNGCVFLHIQCSSMASLMSYFQDYVSGQLALELKVVEEAIRTIDGCEDIALEIVINTEELLETVNGIVTTVSELMRTEGILTQTAEEEIQSIRKNVETGCAEQGYQDDTADFQTSVTSKVVQHSEKNKRLLYEYEKLCDTKECVYWMKAMKGLSITKDTLLPLVSLYFKQFYNNCTVNERGHIQHLLTMASNRDTHKQVFRKKVGGHYVWDVNCSDCKPLLKKLQQAHRKPSHIEWGNIGAGGVDDYWKIAKLFMPYGNKDSRGPEDTDMLAIFELLRTFEIVNFNQEMMDLDQLIRDRNELVHSPDNEILEEKMSDIFKHIFKFLESNRLGEGNTTNVRIELEQLQKKVSNEDDPVYRQVLQIQHMGLEFDEMENEKRDEIVKKINQIAEELKIEKISKNKMEREIKELTTKMKDDELLATNDKLTITNRRKKSIEEESRGLIERILVDIGTGVIVGLMGGTLGAAGFTAFDAVVGCISYAWYKVRGN